MSNVVFILGAGCSKDCGAPLMADFLDVAKRLHNTNSTDAQAADFTKVFKAIGSLQRVHSKSQLDITNVESVFNALDMANSIRKLPDFPVDEIPGVVASLKKVIVTTLEKTIGFPAKAKESYIGAPYPYEEFAGLIRHLVSDAVPTHTVSVVTFNYDIAVDMAMFRGRFGIDYGLSPITQPEGIPLLKLHGSLNWALKSENHEIVPLTLQDYLQEYHLMSFSDSSTCRIPIGTQLQEYFSKHTKIKVNPEPVIVPPTWNKVEYYQSISQVWARAAKELSEAEYIFIIGYSLPETDAFFRLLYALGTVGEAPLDKIEIFNPDDRREIKERFRSLLGPGALARFKYNEQTFAASIGNIKNYFLGRQ